MAALVVSDTEIDVEQVKEKLSSAPHYTAEKFMDSVSTKKEEVYGSDAKSVVVIDTGAKNENLDTKS